MNPAGPSHCCLTCCLREANFPSSIANRIIRERHDFEPVKNQEGDFFHELTEEQRAVMNNIVNTILEVNNGNPIPTVHNPYYSKDAVFFVIFNDIFTLPLSRIQRGDILEIFIDADTKLMTDELLSDIKVDFGAPRVNARIYPDLLGAPSEKYVCFNVSAHRIDVFTPNGINMTFHEEYEHSFDHFIDDLGDWFESVMITIDSVSMIIVENLQEPIDDLIDLFDRVFGGLEQLLVVFVINYDVFQDQAEAKRTVWEISNAGLDAAVKDQIVFLDLGMFNGVEPARDGQGNLILRRWED